MSVFRDAGPAPVVLARRAALGAMARATLAALGLAGALPRDLLAHAAGGASGSWRDVKHPDPRPGVTAERVLAEADVPEKYRDAYRAAREYPQVLDGIFCHCDCEAHRGLRSLLSCYESTMPQSCGICVGEARLARRLHERGKSLVEIRAAVDESYGGRRTRRRDEPHSHDPAHAAGHAAGHAAH
ncbi:MAG: PCYCGC motif-containing (lipo)protein [Gemmatirosa sp.]